MFSTLAAIVISIGITPIATFVKEPPLVTQYYKGPYNTVLEKMHQDFTIGRFPAWATFRDSHNFSGPRPFIKVNLLKAMPVWVDKKKYSKEEGLAWDKMYGIMDGHEDIHLAINQETFVRGLKEMITKTPAQAEKIYSRCLTDAVKLNQIYDSVSDHSRKQQRYVDLGEDSEKRYNALRELRSREIRLETKFRF